MEEHDYLYDVAPRKVGADWEEEFVVENNQLPTAEQTAYRSSANFRDLLIQYIIDNGTNIITNVTNVTNISNPVHNQIAITNVGGDIQINQYDETTEEWTVYNLFPKTYEVSFGTVDMQGEFQIDPASVNGLNDLAKARNVAMYVDFGRRPSTDWSIDPNDPMKIISVDPQTNDGWRANSVYFLIEH